MIYTNPYSIICPKCISGVSAAGLPSPQYPVRMSVFVSFYSDSGLQRIVLGAKRPQADARNIKKYAYYAILYPVIGITAKRRQKQHRIGGF